MFYKTLIVAAAIMAASPAFAGGHGSSRTGGSLLGGIVAPVTSVVSVLNGPIGNGSLNGNHVSVLSGTSVGVAVPINVSRNTILSGNLLSGILGGGSHGCGCR